MGTKRPDSVASVKKRQEILAAPKADKASALQLVAERSAKEKKAALFENVYTALHDDFMVFGKDVIANVREENPLGYLKVITALLPKEAALSFNIEYDPAAELEKLRQQALRPRERDIEGEAQVIRNEA